MFQLKDFPSIVASMVNFMRGTQAKITDFNPGSVARTMIESPAIEIDELYQQMFNGLKEGIPVAVYDSFNFAMLLATSSGGLMRLTITSSATNTIIPANTQFVSTYNLQSYLTSVDTTILAGSTQADIFLSAITPGIIGNIPTPSSPFTTSASIAGLVSAVVLSGFDNGIDDETPAARKSRFNDYISTLRGSTLAALEYGIKSGCKITNAYGIVTEQVVMTNFVEPYLVSSLNPVGWVQAYIHNGVNGASSALLALARIVVDGYVDSHGNKIPGYKAAGVKVDIAAATAVPVGVTGTVSALPGFLNTDVATGVTEVINDYLLARGINQSAQIDDLYAVAKAVSGCNKFTLTTPTADVASSSSSKVMPGTVTITPV